MNLLQRLGLVAWWLGAILGSLCLAVAFAGVIWHEKGYELVFTWLVAALVFAVPSWSVAFILGGSFWSPPRK